MSVFREKKVCYSVIKAMVEEVRKYIEMEEVEDNGDKTNTERRTKTVCKK
jgi:hypothetical protein